MDAMQVIEEMNKGGWMVEGWHNGTWQRFTGWWVDRAVLDHDGIFFHRLLNDGATIGYPHQIDVLKFECVGGTTDKLRIERIMVKAPSDDGSGALRTKLLLVNPGAKIQNIALFSPHRAAVERAKASLAESGIEFEALNAGGVKLTLPGGAEVQFHAAGTMDGITLVIDGAELRKALNNQ